MTSRHRGLTEQAADAAVDSACRLLRLPTIRSQFTDLAEAAARDQMTYRGFLAELLMAECDDRARRRSERRIKAAAFPRDKALRTFDFTANPNVDPAVVHTLAKCDWVKKGLPLCLIGDSGTGKSHLLIALGTEAAMAGHRVRYVLATKLVNELVEAADEKMLAKTIARYGRVNLLCIDELGYMELDRRGAELLFQVLTGREEKASVAIASNEAFSGWTKASVVLFKLYPFMSPVVDAEVNDTRNQLDTVVRLCIMSLLAVPITMFLLWSHGLWLLVPMGCYLFAWAAYRASLAAAMRFCEAISTAFDLHRLQLWDALSLRRPGNLAEERRLAKLLCVLLDGTDEVAIGKQKEFEYLSVVGADTRTGYKCGDHCAAIGARAPLAYSTSRGSYLVSVPWTQRHRRHVYLATTLIYALRTHLSARLAAVAQNRRSRVAHSHRPDPCTAGLGRRHSG
jgi:DNA replication protein DnaC